MNEKWINWKLISNIAKTYFIESVIDGPNGFEIILIDSDSNIKKKDKQKVRVNFGYGVEAYRQCEESFRVELFSRLSKEYGTNFYANKNFFEVKNSEYLKWLTKESGGYSAIMNPKHYVFMDNDCVLDVAAMCEPEVEIMKK